MDSGYYVAAGSLMARAFQLEVVSNNLANAATVGYKPDQPFFAVFNKAAGSGRKLPLSGYLNDGVVFAETGAEALAASRGVCRDGGQDAGPVEFRHAEGKGPVVDEDLEPHRGIRGNRGDRGPQPEPQLHRSTLSATTTSRPSSMQPAWCASRTRPPGSR